MYNIINYIIIFIIYNFQSLWHLDSCRVLITQTNHKHYPYQFRLEEDIVLNKIIENNDKTFEKLTEEERQAECINCALKVILFYETK